jgi:16S rRNA (uracil1498-N3)-methyltransferase
MHYFFAERIIGDQIFFSSDETRHLLKSLRAKEGDSVWVLDGQGSRCLAKISLKEKQATATIEERKTYPKAAHLLHLAIAPTKMPSRLEWLVEKATELGIDMITPIVTTRSEKVRINLERLQKISLSALKQSGNLFLPKINKLTSFDEIIKHEQPSTKIIAHCQTSALPHLNDILKPAAHTTILIGPEGDFTLTEINQAREKGFEEVSLGKLRLRTETAGIYVTTLHTLVNKEY